MTGAQKKILVVVLVVVAIIALVVSCKRAEDERQQKLHDQRVQEFSEQFTQQYLEGVQIMSEMDYDNPDKDKLKQATSDFIMWVPAVRHDDDTDIYSEAIRKTKLPYKDYETNALYNTVCALKQMDYYNNDFQKTASLNDLFISYVKDIPENYSGVCKEKILPFRQKVMDYYENVVKPAKEKPVVRTPAPVRQHTGPGHYDENGYWETEDYDYIDEYDHDGYMDEVFEDNANDYKAPQKSSSGSHRHTGGDTRRWRDK